jgi:hypothetical protein
MGIKEGDEFEIKFSTGLEDINTKICDEKKEKMDKTVYEQFKERKKEISRNKRLEQMNKKYGIKRSERSNELELFSDRKRNRNADYTDNRFTAVNTNPDYARDPTRIKSRKKV